MSLVMAKSSTSKFVAARSAVSCKLQYGCSEETKLFLVFLKLRFSIMWKLRFFPTQVFASARSNFRGLVNLIYFSTN